MEDCCNPNFEDTISIALNHVAIPYDNTEKEIEKALNQILYATSATKIGKI